MSPHSPRLVGRSSITGLPEPEERLREGLRALQGARVPICGRAIRSSCGSRVVLALVLLIAGKLVNIAIPFFYKRAVDALTVPRPGADRGADRDDPRLRRSPGSCRRASTSCATRVFAKVGQRAVRQIALAAFRHIHALSLRFHLERRTGGLARAVERGTAGIEFLLSFMLFNVVPTLFEIIVVCAILWRLYDWAFAARHAC